MNKERKKLIIVGAGGLGRVIHDVLSGDEKFLDEYELAGFLDNRSKVDLPHELRDSVIGSPLTYHPKQGDVFIPAIGNPSWRKKLLAPLIQKNAEFYSYINKASISARTNIGKGVFMTPGAVISTDCEIGDYSYIDTYVIAGHDVHIGPYCTIGAMSFLAGGAHIEEGAAILPRSTIAKDVRIGAGSVVGLGSVVVKDVPKNVTVFGNPARTIYAS